MSNEKIIDNEVRIRILEDIAKKTDKRFEQVDKRFDKLESKMDSQFHWVLGTIGALILTNITIFSGIALHSAKLI